MVKGLLVLITFPTLFCKQAVTFNTQMGSSKITGQAVTDTLEHLGYFRYADSSNLDTVKREIIEAFDMDKVLSSVDLPDRPYTPLCFRLYGCDGEDLFEYGGIVSKLQDIKPTFDKLKIPLQWKDDWYSDDGKEHTITINDKRYFAFKGDPNDMRVWGWATKFFIEMINDQLTIHNSEERLYPIMAGNEGRIVFLTKPQYDFIRKHFDNKEGPLEVEEWWKQN